MIDRTLDETVAEISEIERLLDEDRRRADPNRGVICARGCEPGCDHVAYLVEAIKARRSVVTPAEVTTETRDERTAAVRADPASDVRAGNDEAPRPHA